MSVHVKNLGDTIAPGGKPQTIPAKLDATYFSLVVDLEHKADVEQLGFVWVIQCKPILTILPGINK